MSVFENNNTGLALYGKAGIFVRYTRFKADCNSSSVQIALM